MILTKDELRDEIALHGIRRNGTGGMLWHTSRWYFATSERVDEIANSAASRPG